MVVSLACWSSQGGQGYHLDAGFWYDRHVQNLFLSTLCFVAAAEVEKHVYAEIGFKTNCYPLEYG